MHPTNRFIGRAALIVVVALAAACGGQPAEGPAPAAPEPQPAAPAPEPAPAAPAPVVEEPVEPQAPTLQGAIVEIPEAYEFGWFNAATRDTPGRYHWAVRLRNDTTSTLDITVSFQFLDDNERQIRTDRKTERLQPAQEVTFRYEGEMDRDNSRAATGITYSWDWRIVEGNS